MIISYMTTAKVAVTVDVELLAEVERLRARTKESRSAVFNRAIKRLANAEARTAKVRVYIEAYRRMPETAAEMESADALARESLRNAPPWDDS